MRPVSVIILHREAGASAGPLERALATARRALAERHARAFGEAGARRVRVVSGPPDDLSFGARLQGLRRGQGGAVVLGSGSIPLARVRDLQAFVEAAANSGHIALANNSYSADVVAIARLDRLPALPDLPADNALPRWLAETAGWQVSDLRQRWRLQVDLDSPLDLLLTGVDATALAGRRAEVTDRLAAVREALAHRRREVVVAGRTSASALAWLERHAASRIRALVEERGLRASSPLALAVEPTVGKAHDGPERAPADATAEAIAGALRRPRSILGLVLDRTGPEGLGDLLTELGDAALVDTRVLLAHRLGPDERGWPAEEDRFASDLLDANSVVDPWLRALTASARDARIPVVLGGHSLVGPGVRLVVRGPVRGR